MAGNTTLSAEWQPSGDGDVDPVCFPVACVCYVNEVRDVFDVVEFGDEKMPVESAIDVSVVLMDLFCGGDGRCHFLEAGVCDVRWDISQKHFRRESARNESTVSDTVFRQCLSVETLTINVLWQGKVDLAGLFSPVVAGEFVCAKSQLMLFGEALEELLDLRQGYPCSTLALQDHEDGVVWVLRW